MIIQIAILVTGISVIFLLRNGMYRKLGYIIGLLGQPFWLYSSYIHSQWGMFLISILYVWVWGIGVMKTYGYGSRYIKFMGNETPSVYIANHKKYKLGGTYKLSIMHEKHTDEFGTILLLDASGTLYHSGFGHFMITSLNHGYGNSISDVNVVKRAIDMSEMVICEDEEIKILTMGY